MKHTPWVINDRKIKIAVLGLGRISKNHLQAIEQYHDKLELLGVCDGREDLVNQIAEQYQVKGYYHLDEMLADTDADIVSICTQVVSIQPKPFKWRNLVAMY